MATLSPEAQLGTGRHRQEIHMHAFGHNTR